MSEDLKYDLPDIDNWPAKDPRRDCLSWDGDFLRQLYNDGMGKWQPATDHLSHFIGHPYHPFLNRARGFALDIGCGNGSMLLSLKSDGAIESGIGIDIADIMIENANQTARNVNVSGVTFIRSSLEEFETDIFFHTVIAYDILEHLISVTKGIAKIASLLKLDGALIGSVPHDRNCDDYEFKVHLHYFKEDDLYDLFRPLFKQVEVIGKRISEKEYRYYFFSQGVKI